MNAVKRRWVQFSLRGLLVLTAATALAASWLRPPEIKASIELVEFSQAEGAAGPYRTAVFRLTNESRNSVWFEGYGREHPWYSTRTGPPEPWFSPLWCGTGVEAVELRPGESARFAVEVLPDQKTIETGIQLSAYRAVIGDARSEFVASEPVWAPTLP